MPDPADPETQLRLIIKTHAADSEHLLDEVLAQEREYTQTTWATKHHWKARAETAERSLSALREAVRAVVDMIGLSILTLEPGQTTIDLGRIPVAWARRILAAHDAAPAAPALTLEEVEEKAREVYEQAIARREHSDAALRLAIHEAARLAQKGAGRG